ncbi:MAG: hypothetical protein QOE82_384 [Thermoanaerobaculia bacterium]|jgi:hypothetical protein|nr:hypothetical protein [Thermoanaerobaculia bacterium]
MRIITIRLADFVDETRRRERRGGAVFVAIAALTIAAIVSKPAAKKAPEIPVVTQTIPPTNSTAVIVNTATNTATNIATNIATNTATNTATATTTTTATTASTAPSPPLLAPARAAAAPKSLRFAPLTAGGSSPAQLVAIRNSGEQPLAIRQVSSNGAAFHVTNGCAGPLDRGASCSVAVVFAPPRAGEFAGNMTVATSAGTLTVPLRGAATPVPPVELAPLDFGRQQIGQKVDPQRVRFVNSGAAPVAIGETAIAGDPFSIAANRCQGIVPPGGECDLLVTFVPRDGHSEGEIKLLSEGNLVAHAAITGTGFQPRPPVHLDITPRQLHFLFGVTPPQRITITNPSSEPVKIYSVRAVGGGGRSFKVSAEKCEGTTLQPRGGSCVIVVTVTASFRLADSMQILVDHSGADRPDSIGASAAPR